jgi:hypothetical protein
VKRLIRGRLVDAEWIFFESFVIETGPKRGRPLAITDEVSMKFSGLREPTRPDAICPMNSASGARSIGSFSDGGEPDFGMLEALATSQAVPNTVQMIHSTIVSAHHQQAEKGIQKNPLGHSRGGFLTEIHLRTNAQGLRRSEPRGAGTDNSQNALDDVPNAVYGPLTLIFSALPQPG